MKKLPIYISLLLLITCSKDNPDTIDNSTPDTILPKYTLTANAGDGGSVSGGGTFASGTQVSLTATPTSGYSFSGWSNGTTANPLTVTLNSNTSITANFEVLINSYTLTVVSTDGGSATGAGEYNEGTEVTLTATASEGYRFTGWSDGSTEESITITLSEDTALTANFELIVIYNLILESVTGGSVTGAGEYNEGTEVTITAIPDDGYEFTEWSDGNTSISRTLTINSDINIQALFDIQIIIIQLDQHYISQPSIVGFNDKVTTHETTDYIISKKGWLGITNEELHNGGNYGNRLIEPGVATFLYKHILNTDLNNDGLQDIVMGIDRNPHTVSSSQSGIPFFSLINLGDGTFEFSQQYFSQDFQRSPMSMYRSVVDDLNGDGKKDFILGMRNGPVVSLIDGGMNSGPALPLLALSSENGYFDNSSNLSGIYPGTINENDCCDINGFPYFISDRGMALGDFDNDGDIDFFITRKILLNDGNGNFSMSNEQLSNNLIPEFIDPPWSNTYEAHTDDFNNDGFFDIVIVPDSGYISRNGGSGWIAISNGTSNFSEWEKLQLPDPIYLNNSKLNDLESTDFDNDGDIDLILATTRDNPYYVGHGIQLLRNDNGNQFVDVTNSKIDNQSLFDQRHGEGELIIKDFNNDNKMDIIHLIANYGASTPGIQIYENNNGYFEIYDTDNLLPKTGWNHLKGYGQQEITPTIKRAFPININNDGKLDFISIQREVGEFPKITTNVFYSIISKN
jgi:hypothetical protein